MTATNLLSHNRVDELLYNLLAILILPYKEKICDQVEKGEVVEKEGKPFDVSYSRNTLDA